VVNPAVLHSLHPRLAKAKQKEEGKPSSLVIALLVGESRRGYGRSHPSLQKLPLPMGEGWGEGPKIKGREP
jgi:hypothetical protein